MMMMMMIMMNDGDDDDDDDDDDDKDGYVDDRINERSLTNLVGGVRLCP